MNRWIQYWHSHFSNVFFNRSRELCWDASETSWDSRCKTRHLCFRTFQMRLLLGFQSILCQLGFLHSSSLNQIFKHIWLTRIFNKNMIHHIFASFFFMIFYATRATRVARNKQQNPQLKTIHKNTSAGQPKQQTPGPHLYHWGNHSKKKTKKWNMSC